MIAEYIIPKDKKRDVNQLYTLEQYFELEEKAAFKSEFVNGKIIPMAGGTLNHGNISGMIYALLLMLSLKEENNWSSYNSDQKIFIEGHNRTVYSDTFVVLGETKTYENAKLAITNPGLVVEVLSKSTESYDRGNKFRMYQSMSSFKEYVIVNQDMPVIEVFHKIGKNKWEMTSYVGLDKEVTFESLGVSLKMADIYQTAIDLQNPQVFIDFPESN